jgi:uncharacterized protein (TIGR03083 family)
MEPLGPIYTAPLFAPLHAALIDLLVGLQAADWTRPTIAGAWRVRDVAAHLLEVDLRRLSAGRDGHRIEPERPIRGYSDLVDFLNGLNAQWVAAARRLSPGVLIDLLQYSGPAMARMVADLPPHEPAVFAVDWAGESRSENWFDIGRDYTERWHHQMQIRDAVGAPGLLQPRWIVPLLDLSVRSLPRTYAGTPLKRRGPLELRVAVDGGAVWSVCPDVASAPERDAGPGSEVGQWRVWRGAAPSPAAVVHLDPDTAWRMFYNALSPAEALARASVEGDASLAEPLFRARSVMV